MRPVLAVFMLASAWALVESFHMLGHEFDRTPLGDSIDKASLKLLKEAYQSGSEKNVVSSPLGVLLLLSFYAAGASDGIRQELGELLGNSDYSEFSSAYSGLSRQFASMDPSYLTLANKIYVAKDLSLNEQFDQTARSSYRSEVEELDFTDANAAAATINQWASEKTKGHIKDPVSPSILTPDTVAALFNVIFFQGHWHVPFNASETQDQDFHVDRSTVVKKPTMHLLQSLFYTESSELGAKLVELPYKELGFRMVVVLPDEIDGLPSVLEKASQKGLLEDVFKLEPSGRDVDLYIPKFEVKSKLDLNEILPKIGVSKIFTDPAPGIVKNGPVRVSKAFQEAFVKVDEEGATAGAFTGLVAVYMSLYATEPPALEFRVDRPFMYLILHEDKILFAGTYSH